MFTGIVTDVGELRAIEERADRRLVIATAYDTDSIPMGGSICCSGVCLTVVDKGADWFAVDVSRETLACTTLGGWSTGAPVNLERSLRVGDELGGHIVSGHVDGVGRILDVRDVDGSREVDILLPDSLAPLVAQKGSIAVDGVSLTVNRVTDPPEARATVNIIPHTLEQTRFGAVEAGEPVNIEIDILARYLDRLRRLD